MPRPFQIVCLLIFSSVLFSSTLAYSQTEGPAVVTFTIDFPTSQPEHYSIRVQSDGLARYQSSGRRSPDSDETDSFDLDFTVAAETRQKIFELAAKAGYFQKDVDSHQVGYVLHGGFGRVVVCGLTAAPPVFVGERLLSRKGEV